MTPPIWIFDFASQEIEKIEHERTNDRDPVWIGDKVYFISDRNRITNVFSYDTRTKAVSQVTHHDDFDVLSATGAGQSIYYEQAGRIRRLDTGTGTQYAIPVLIQADQPAARPHGVDASKTIESVALSPDGGQVAFAARGDVHLVAAKSGHSVNLTHSSDSHERDPVWSADGKRLAWCSDKSGEYQLVIYSLEDRRQRVIPLEKSPELLLSSQLVARRTKPGAFKQAQRAVVGRCGERGSPPHRARSTRAFGLWRARRDFPRTAATSPTACTCRRICAPSAFTTAIRGRFTRSPTVRAIVPSPTGARMATISISFPARISVTKTTWLSIGNIGQRSFYTFYVAALGKDTPPRLPADGHRGHRETESRRSREKDKPAKAARRRLRRAARPHRGLADQAGQLRPPERGS